MPSISNILSTWCNLQASLLHDLNAVSTTDIGELDYDTIISAYEKINPDLFCLLKVDHALLILSHCIYYVSSDELILRQSASKSLLAFVQFASSYLKTDSNITHDAEGKQASAETSGKPNWTRAHVLSIINDVLSKNMREALSKEISIRKVCVVDVHYNLFMLLPPYFF